MTCYYCEAPLTDKNKSREHIFPDFVGGKIISTDLLCSDCNPMLGSSIDSALYSQIKSYADLLVISRERKLKRKEIRLEDAEGNERRVGENLFPKCKLYLPTPKGEIILYADNDDELKKLAEKKIREMGGDKKVKVSYFQEPPSEKMYYFKNNISREPGEIGFGGRDFMKAICKIAIGYSLHVGRSKEEITTALDFFKNNHKINETVAFWYPSGKHQIHSPKENEVVNLICLKGDPELRVLYCYIEILSFKNFIVILNMEYSGEEFSSFYCHDVLLNKNIEKELNLKMHREEFQIIRYIGNSHTVEHEHKLNRINNIIEKMQDKTVPKQK